MPLPLSRAFNTTPDERADVFPSQLDDPSTAAVLSSLKTTHAPQTLTEKIVQRYCLGTGKDQYVKAGDYVTLSPAYCMTHDNSWPTALKFMSIGASKIFNKRQIVMTLDHDVQNKSESNLKKYRQIEEFAKSQGVDFYPAGRGIGHQIMIEEGYAFPGSLAVASDSHSNMYGGVGCLGTPVRTPQRLLPGFVPNLESQDKYRSKPSFNSCICLISQAFYLDEATLTPKRA